MDKQEKLKELANKRVPSAVKRIKLVGNLANYKPTAAEVDRRCHAHPISARRRGLARQRGRERTQTAKTWSWREI